MVAKTADEPDDPVASALAFVRRAPRARLLSIEEFFDAYHAALEEIEDALRAGPSERRSAWERLDALHRFLGDEVTRRATPAGLPPRAS